MITSVITRKWNKLETGDKALVKLGAICVVLILIITALSVALNAQTSATKASERARAYCTVSKSIAEAPLSKDVTDLGITISAGFRLAYRNAGCTLGALTPADPRVKAKLPVGVN